MPKKKPQKGKPQVHKDLKGFEIQINKFGQITSNLNVEELNEFLNENVEDKKLKEQDNEQDTEQGEPDHNEEEE